MFITTYCGCPNCERRVDRRFLRTLQDQGHSIADIFSITLDIEFNEKARIDRVMSRAIRQGAIDGYFYFERDNNGAWDILLTELGRQRNQGLDNL